MREHSRRDDSVLTDYILARRVPIYRMVRESPATYPYGLQPSSQKKAKQVEVEAKINETTCNVLPP